MAFQGNGLRAKSATAIRKCIEVNESLLELDIAGNPFSQEDIQEIAQSLANNSTLRMLDLSYITIEEQTLYSILQQFPNMSLTQLKMNGCKFGVIWTTEIGKALENNNSLIDLELGFESYINDDGMIAFGKALMKNTTLQTLRLPISYSPFCWEEEFIECLSQNYTLTEISVEPKDVQLKLNELMQRNKSLLSESRFKSTKPVTNEANWIK